MDKNSIIGFVLIGVIFFGFTWYQSRQYKAQREVQAQIDSAARAEQALKLAEEAVAEPEIAEVTATEAKESPVRASSHGTYRDSALNAAASAENSYVTLANDKVEIVFSTKGAQPYSVKIKDFRTYDSTDLYLVKPGMSSYGISVFAGENIDTRNFVFDVVGHTDSTLTMRLPFSNGGYIEQRFSLPQGSYMMANELSFIGLDGLIPRKINSADIDWTVIIPRLEKGYSNEKQYSKVNYYFSGEKKPEQLGRGGRNDEEQIVSKVKWFAFQHWNLDPDIVTVAKALSGGYVPCAAFVTTREIHQSTFSSLERCVVHSTTFGRNNLAMVCGLASIDVIEKEGMVENCAKMGAKLLERLNALKEKHSYIKEVRGLGLMIAIEFQEPKGILQKAAWRALNAANKSLFTQMIVTALMDNHRIITQVTCHEVHAVKILPPFIITDAEIDKFIDAFDKVLSEAANPTGALWKFGKRLIAASISDKSSK